ncbi:MAG: GerMN domain-containing protein [Treponema sp.]|nr:GerMN domain-containing protein [Treponema sp.]
MNSEETDSPVVFPRPRISLKKLLLVILAALAATACIEFLVLGLARKTFVFYAIDSGKESVEERALKTGVSPVRPSSRELQITRYVEEALLGPISAGSLPLFPRETRLLSLLYRNGVVYVDLSEDAALPPLESAFSSGGEVFTGLETLYQGIKRNFSFVKDVRFFIAGKAAYAGKFR